MREYSATVGATDGNIIAAIITTQTPRNQPSVPRPVQGPLSIPRIWPSVHHQPLPARAKSTVTRPSRARAAPKCGARPVPGARSCAGAITCSNRPRELGGRETCFALVLDPEGVDSRAGRLRDRQVRRHRMEHPGKANRLSGLDTKGHDVFDLEIDDVPDPNAVAHTVVLHLDRR